MEQCEEHWTEHLLMITGTVGGKVFLFINVYAPSNGVCRVKFFQTLQSIKFPDDAEIVCEGDFNCVLDQQVDRIGGDSTDDVGAKDLRQFVDMWGLVDAGWYTKPSRRTAQEVRRFAEEYHTHRHTAASGEVGTSRIDRWYVVPQARNTVRGIVTSESPFHADHREVLLELHPPTGAIRLKKRQKVYPPRKYVTAAMNDLTRTRLKELAGKMETMAPNSMAGAWDRFKTSLKTEMGRAKKHASQRMTTTYRQKIKRIKKQLAKAGFTGTDQDERRKELLAKMQSMQDERRNLRRRGLIAKNAWSSNSSTKHFFNRVSTEFGVNILPALTPTSAESLMPAHAKADILAESWEPIFNGEATAKAGMADYIDKLAPKWPTVDMSEVDDDITEQEVAEAIKHYKKDKACGPDDLSNECDGFTPTSFAEAYIFSISKGGNVHNPLNCRPIALLNTDYKVFTRILAWRVRRHLPKPVHQTQYGFVPGRTIHEAIDLYEAVKRRCRQTSRYKEAQVLMLDFQKAYDSLDREFLLRVLAKKGFPPKFCKMVEAIHANTTVKFMANGTLSGPVRVTRGIWQGCPLAPILFILAVDLLYDEVEADATFRGIDMESTDAGWKAQVGGYADDTALYIEHCNMQAAAILAVQRFSGASGLLLNVQKSVAINLGQGSVRVTHPNGAPHAEAQKGHDHIRATDHTGTSETDTRVEEVESARYLGHIAGTEDTTEEAWNRRLGRRLRGLGLLIVVLRALRRLAPSKWLNIGLLSRLPTKPRSVPFLHRSKLSKLRLRA